MVDTFKQYAADVSNSVKDWYARNTGFHGNPTRLGAYGGQPPPSGAAEESTKNRDFLGRLAQFASSTTGKPIKEYIAAVDSHVPADKAEQFADVVASNVFKLSETGAGSQKDRDMMDQRLQAWNQSRQDYIDKSMLNEFSTNFEKGIHTSQAWEQLKQGDTVGGLMSLAAGTSLGQNYFPGLRAASLQDYTGYMLSEPQQKLMRLQRTGHLDEPAMIEQQEQKKRNVLLQLQQQQMMAQQQSAGIPGTGGGGGGGSLFSHPNSGGRLPGGGSQGPDYERMIDNMQTRLGRGGGGHGSGGGGGGGPSSTLEATRRATHQRYYGGRDITPAEDYYKGRENQFPLLQKIGKYGLETAGNAATTIAGRVFDNLIMPRRYQMSYSSARSDAAGNQGGRRGGRGRGGGDDDDSDDDGGGDERRLIQQRKEAREDQKIGIADRRTKIQEEKLQLQKDKVRYEKQQQKLKEKKAADKEDYDKKQKENAQKFNQYVKKKTLELTEKKNKAAEELAGKKLKLQEEQRKESEALKKQISDERDKAKKEEIKAKLDAAYKIHTEKQEAQDKHFKESQEAAEKKSKERIERETKRYEDVKERNEKLYKQRDEHAQAKIDLMTKKINTTAEIEKEKLEAAKQKLEYDKMKETQRQNQRQGIHDAVLEQRITKHEGDMKHKAERLAHLTNVLQETIVHRRNINSRRERETDAQNELKRYQIDKNADTTIAKARITAETALGVARIRKANPNKRRRPGDGDDGDDGDDDDEEEEDKESESEEEGYYNYGQDDNEDENADGLSLAHSVITSGINREQQQQQQEDQTTPGFDEEEHRRQLRGERGAEAQSASRNWEIHRQVRNPAFLVYLQDDKIRSLEGSIQVYLERQIDDMYDEVNEIERNPGKDRSYLHELHADVVQKLNKLDEGKELHTLIAEDNDIQRKLLSEGKKPWDDKERIQELERQHGKVDYVDFMKNYRSVVEKVKGKVMTDLQKIRARVDLPKLPGPPSVAAAEEEKKEKEEVLEMNDEAPPEDALELLSNMERTSAARATLGTRSRRSSVFGSIAGGRSRFSSFDQDAYNLERLPPRSPTVSAQQAPPPPQPTTAQPVTAAARQVAEGSIATRTRSKRRRLN